MKNNILKGIYKITCVINNKVYIGQTKNLKNRKMNHIYKLNHNIHSNRYLQEDYNKYGLSNFKFELVEECKTEDLLERETYWINYYGGKESSITYNFIDLQGASNDAKKYRRKLIEKGIINKSLSEEVKNKIRKAHLGMKASKESKLKCSNTLKGRIFSEETRRKISENRKGKYTGNTKYTQEFIDILRNEYKNNPNYSALSRKYNISDCSIRNLILYGTTSTLIIKQYNS